MDHCCLLWARTRNLDRLEHRVKYLVYQVFREELQPLSIRRDVYLWVFSIGTTLADVAQRCLCSAPEGLF